MTVGRIERGLTRRMTVDTVDSVERGGPRCTFVRYEVLKHLDAVEEFVVTCDHHVP